MEIRGSYLNKALVQMAQAEGKELNLTRGEVLKALVEGVTEDGRVLLTLKGLTIEARAEASVSPGQELLLLVEDFRDGRTYLKIVTPEIMQSIERDRISTSLQQMGIKTSELLLDAGQKLLQYGLPITQENLEMVIRGARMLGGPADRNLETSALCLAAGIKPESRVLQAVQQFMSASPDFRQYLVKALEILQTRAVGFSGTVPAEAEMNAADQEQMTAALKTDGQSSGPAGRQPAAPANITGSAQQMPAGSSSGLQQGSVIGGQSPNSEIQVVKGNPLSAEPETGQANSKVPEAASDNTAGRLSAPEISRRNGLAGEGVQTGDRSTAPFSGPQMQATESVAAGKTLTEPGISSTGQFPSSVLQTTTPDFTNKLEEMVRLLLDVSQLDERESKPLAREVEQFFRENKNILKALLLMDEVLRKDPQTAHNQANQALLNSLQEAGREIIGQAVFNSVDRMGPESPYNYYYFSLPVLVNGEQRQVELRIYRDERSPRSLDQMDEIKIAVGLNTRALGQVLFHVTWKKNAGLTLQGAVDNQPAREYLERRVDQLVKNLEALGFEVRYLGLKTVTPVPELHPGADRAETRRTCIIGVDIVV